MSQFTLAIILVLILIICVLWISIRLIKNKQNSQNIETEEDVKIPPPLVRPPPPPVRHGLMIRVIRRTTTPRVDILKDNTEPQSYFEKIQTHDDDSQNVHNSQVITDLTKKYQKLVELYENDQTQTKELTEAGLSLEEIQNVRVQETILQIENCANKHFKPDVIEGNDEKLKNVKRFLEDMNKGYSITSLSPHEMPIKENWILTLVWQRIHNQDNQKNVELMEIALLDQLIDCVQKDNDALNMIMQFLFNEIQDEDEPENMNENKSLVCINGRVARVISSLSLLDNDPVLFEPIRDEKELANMAYSKASSILQEELKVQNMEKIYISTEKRSKEEQEKLEKFEKHVKDQIERTLLADYKDVISESKLKEIIEKSKAGV